MVCGREVEHAAGANKTLEVLDGIADFLEVKCWVNPTTNGNYILAGDLVDADGTNRFSQSAAFAADGNGPTTVTLIFDLAEMGAGDEQDTYHIENLQLFDHPQRRRESVSCSLRSNGAGRSVR